MVKSQNIVWEWFAKHYRYCGTVSLLPRQFGASVGATGPSRWVTRVACGHASPRRQLQEHMCACGNQTQAGGAAYLGAARPASEGRCHGHAPVR